MKKKVKHYIIKPGDKFERLTVLDFAGLQNSHKLFNVLCDCGTKKIVLGSSMIQRHTKSCGCLIREKTSLRSRGNYRTEQGESGFNTLYRHYIKSAKKRGHVFELTEEEFRVLTKMNCEYCTSEPFNVSIVNSSIKETVDHSKYVYSGIDRVNNSRGYTIDNTVPCCSICNYLKRKLTLDQWNAWIDRITDARIAKRKNDNNIL